MKTSGAGGAKEGDLKIAIVPHDDLVDINKKENVSLVTVFGLGSLWSDLDWV